MSPADLPDLWREKATELREAFGAHGRATTLEWAAADLEETWRAWQMEPLTLEEASDESGYTYSALQQMVADGRLRNTGEKGRPRVCRRDLPRKAQGEPPLLDSGEPDLAAEILAGASA